jgi:hypothetical protein
MLALMLPAATLGVDSVSVPMIAAMTLDLNGRHHARWRRCGARSEATRSGNALPGG